MMYGDTIQDNICLAEASAAGAFDIKRRPEVKTCRNVGRVVYVVTETALSTWIISKLSGPFKKKFKKILLKRRAKKDAALSARAEKLFGKKVSGFDEYLLEKSERSVDKIFKIMKVVGAINTIAGAEQKVSKIPACTKDWSAAEKQKVARAHFTGTGGGPDDRPVSKPIPASSKSLFMYGVQKDGKLLMYELNKAFHWHQHAAEIGTGWRQTFRDRIFTGGPGEFYGIKPDGKLLYYRWDFAGRKWSIAGKEIGTGWHEFADVFSGGGGVVYAIRTNGDLLGYRHDKNGKWVVAGKKFGTGWHGNVRQFAGGDGVIYVQRGDGRLDYFKHSPRFEWITTNRTFGNGWNSAAMVTALGGGWIAMSRHDDKFMLYRHDLGLNWRITSRPIDHGWSARFGNLIMASKEKIKIPAVPFNPDHGWTKLPRKFIDVGGGSDGTVWAVGTDKAAYEWGARGWIKRPGPPPLRRIDVKGYQEVWAVAENGEIWRSRYGQWKKMPGTARDVGVGAGGHVFIVGTDRNPYFWYQEKWVRRPGSGQDTIDVDPFGNIWIVNASNIIWRWHQNGWHEIKGLKARDVAVDPSGRVFVTGVDGRGYQWRGGNNWHRNPSSGAQVSVTAVPAGPLTVNSSNEIWKVK